MSLFKFHKRKFWHFKSGKCISLEATGFHQAPHFAIRVDGSERELQFHIALFVGVWITFEGFLPEAWYPRRWSAPYGWLPDERAFRIYWFESALWWNFWMREDEWNSTDPKWRRGSIHFDTLIKGKRTCTWENIDGGRFLLPFFEGCYEVEVIKKLRTDSYQRWFSRKSIAFEVRCDVGIPHEGKGESDWDQGENATYSISFPGIRTRNNTLYEAALYFWTSCMEDRMRYGRANWVPRRYRPLNVNVIQERGLKQIEL